MTQILNLLLFIRELIFGRDATSRMTRGQRIKSTVIIALFFVSLICIYYLFTSLYAATSKNLALKDEIKILKTQIASDRDLALEIELLEKVLQTVTGEPISGKSLVDTKKPVQTIPVPVPTQESPSPDNPTPVPTQPKVIILQPTANRDETLPDSPKIE